MVEITAEIIERGRGGDPRVVADRRRIAKHVQAAREKLTSSGTGHRAFDMELLGLYAERRRSTRPIVIAVGAALAIVTAQSSSSILAGLWLTLHVIATIVTQTMASRFLAGRTELTVRRWMRLFAVAETFQGVVWASVALLAGSLGDASASTFVLIALLLVAAMNATTTASIPAAVYGSVVPTAITVTILVRPDHIADGKLLLVALTMVTLLYFVRLARELHGSAVRTLSFRADKDDLIAELEQSKSNSDLARRRAEESNLAKSRFLATMSHELRTPLNAILGFSEVMKSELFGPLSVPAYRDYAGDIHASGEHLLMLINEILDLSRVEAGRYELREETVDLLGIVEECRHLVALRAKKKDITIVQEPGPMLPRLWADARALRQVTLNLLSNAIKFTPQGGQVTIRLSTTADGGQLYAISDTGAGIPESEIPVVMSSFGRGSLAHKNAEEGTGLGLPIVKGLVELHGGTFELTSRVREGTTVTVRFPPGRVMTALPQLAFDLPETRVAA